MRTHEETLAKKRAYNKKNKARIDAYNREYRNNEENKEKIKARQELYKELNPEKLKEGRKAVRLKQKPSIEQSKIAGTHFKKWTNEEVRLLLSLRSNNISYSNCALKLDRSFRSVENKLRLLSQVGQYFPNKGVTNV